MKTRNLITISLIAVFLTSCLGDKKQIDVEEANDTASFINKDFKGNLIDYSENMSACDRMTKVDLANLYNVSEDDIIWMDSASNERMNSNKPTCNFRVMLGENEFNYLIGGITVNREIKKDEMMGEIAEASGSGENWKEAWALQKSMSESAEWIDGVGLAAMWKPKRRELHIKFEGYSLYVMAPGSAINQEENAKNRDYKSIASAMARNAGFIN